MTASDRRFWLLYFLTLAMLAFMLAGCAGGNSPAPTQTPAVYMNVQPGSSTWQMVVEPTPTWAEYNYRSFTGGTYDPATGLINYDRATEAQISVGRQTNLATRMPTDQRQLATARVQSQGGTMVTAVDPQYTLVERQSTTLIGEAANPVASLIDPPEPYLTVVPVVGEVINTLHYVVAPAQQPPFYFSTRYQTVAVDVTFDGFEHATVTTLTENPGDAGSHETAYVWVFSQGEIAEEIIGVVGAGNIITQGNLIRRTQAGANP